MDLYKNRKFDRGDFLMFGVMHGSFVFFSKNTTAKKSWSQYGSFFKIKTFAQVLNKPFETLIPNSSGTIQEQKIKKNYHGIFWYWDGILGLMNGSLVIFITCILVKKSSENNVAACSKYRHQYKSSSNLFRLCFLTHNSWGDFLFSSNIVFDDITMLFPGPTNQVPE